MVTNNKIKKLVRFSNKFFYFITKVLHFYVFFVFFTNILQLVLISVIIYISIIVSDKMVQNKGGNQFGYT